MECTSGTMRRGRCEAFIIQPRTFWNSGWSSSRWWRSPRVPEAALRHRARGPSAAAIAGGRRICLVSCNSTLTKSGLSMSLGASVVWYSNSHLMWECFCWLICRWEIRVLCCAWTARGVMCPQHESKWMCRWSYETPSREAVHA